MQNWQGTLDSHQLRLRSERSASAPLACPQRLSTTFVASRLRRREREENEGARLAPSCSPSHVERREGASHGTWRTVWGSNPSLRLEGPRISQRSNRSVLVARVGIEPTESWTRAYEARPLPLRFIAQCVENVGSAPTARCLQDIAPPLRVPRWWCRRQKLHLHCVSATGF